MAELVLILMGSNPGGIELQIPSMIDYLDDLEPVVYLVHGMRTTDNCIFAGTDVIPVRGAGKLPLSAIRLFGFARKNRNCIFHVFNIGPLFLLVIRLAGVRKIVYSIRGTIYWKKPWQKLINKLLWELALSKMVRLVSNSDYSAAVFKQHVSCKFETKTIYNPIDSKFFFRLRESYPETPQKIIYVGRLANGKNLHLWLDSAKQISEQYNDAEYHIYGDGPERQELETYAKNIGMTGRITFHGYLKEIVHAYTTSDLMIFLSDHESFGNVVVESILAGTPVICSDIPSLREIFKDHPEFLIVLNKHTPYLVMQKIRDYNILKESAKITQTEFLTRFSIERHIRQLREVYGSF